MSKNIKNLSPLEAGITEALSALNNQILREIQRSPTQREGKGLSKSEPINKRVELLTGIILNLLGEEHCSIEALIVLAESSVKALRMTCEDLETEGLGKMRSLYVADSVSKIYDDSRKVLSCLNQIGDDLM
jgi:hypothetical protein